MMEPELSGEEQILDTSDMDTAINSSEKTVIDEILKSVLNFSVDDFEPLLKGLVESFQYQGFSLTFILKSMSDSRNKFIGNPHREWNFDGVIVKEDGNIQRDLCFLLALYCTKGPGLAKIMETNSMDVHDALCYMKACYGINTETRGRDAVLGPRVVTLARIAACFPHLVCELFHTGDCRALVQLKQIHALDYMSPALLTPLFASCAWRGSSISPFPLIVLASLESDPIINKGKAATPHDKLIKYCSAAYRSDMFNDTQRLYLCKKWGMIGEGSPIDWNRQMKEAILNSLATLMIRMGSRNIEVIKSTH